MPAAPARHILFLNWRDTHNPEGGGSEVYTERIAAELVAHGHRVTLLCAAHGDAPAEQVLPSDVHILRRGGRHTVYLRAALTYLAGACRLGRLAAGVRGRPDLIVDVCNGVPFLSPLYARCPTVVVVHHVHREQWPVVFGDWRGRFGWWLESRVAPRVYRRCRYVTVSAATRDELVRLGVAAARISIIQNGLPGASERAAAGDQASPGVNNRAAVASARPPGASEAAAGDGDVSPGRAAYPCLVVLGRLVPHKRVEYALDALAALAADLPGLRLIVAGRGWWEPRLREYAAMLGVEGHTEFAGYVTERRKHELLSHGWLALVPSLKEGWGLTIMEAAARETPAIAFRGAGGVCDAIRHGHTGLLADDPGDFVAKIRWLLTDDRARRRMGEAARRYAETFTWPAAGNQLASLVDGVLGSDQRAP